MKRIEESTETVERGLHNPLVYILIVLGIFLVPVTGGLSVILIVIALLMLTGGGKACVQAIPPAKEDIVAPAAGCTRIVGALVVLAALVFVVFLFLAIVAYNMGVQP